MSKRWIQTHNVTSLFYTSHKSSVGGGEIYAHQIASCFDELTNMRYYGPAPASDFRRNHFFQHRFTHTGLLSHCDIFINASHFEIKKPIGRHRNILICYFPNKEHSELVKGYDTIITTSKFCKEWIWKYWKKQAVVIHPYIDGRFWHQEYLVRNHPRRIINVGHFFKEADGHGKRQDVLIDAFHKLKHRETGYELFLVGNVNNQSDRAFVTELEKKTKELGIEDDVHFHLTPDVETLKNLYLSSSIYWHANGYKQKDPYKTEHFGIVIVEAMRCGCIPIIYENGGYEEFDCMTWKDDNFEDLILNTLATQYVDDFYRTSMVGQGMEFNRETMKKQVKDLLVR